MTMTTASTMWRGSRQTPRSSNSRSLAIVATKSSPMEGKTCSKSSTLVRTQGPKQLDYLLPKAEQLQDFNVTLGIDVSKLPKKQCINIFELYL